MKAKKMMTEKKTTYHKPVLLKEAVDALNIHPDGVYVDVTFGGGGHSRAILGKLGEKGRLIAFDRDEDAQKNAIEDPRFTLIRSDYRFLKNFLRLHGIKKIDGLLADLGISSHQIDEPSRGFSTRHDAPLDMRMDTGQRKTAIEVINKYSEEELKNILETYGEVKNAKNMARAIVKARAEKPIETTGQLVEIVSKHIPLKLKNKMLAKIFQAIRIEVNEELESLKQMLKQAQEVIKPGGRLAVITYHSLEDRLVKRFIQSGNFEGVVEKDFYGNVQVPFKKTGKFIVPTKEEIEENPRARSAKLRVAEKIQEN